MRFRAGASSSTIAARRAATLGCSRSRDADAPRYADNDFGSPGLPVAKIETCRPPVKTFEPAPNVRNPEPLAKNIARRQAAPIVDDTHDERVTLGRRGDPHGGEVRRF